MGWNKKSKSLQICPQQYFNVSDAICDTRCTFFCIIFSSVQIFSFFFFWALMLVLGAIWSKPLQLAIIIFPLQSHTFLTIFMLAIAIANVFGRLMYLVSIMCNATLPFLMCKLFLECDACYSNNILYGVGIWDNTVV